MIDRRTIRHTIAALSASALLGASGLAAAQTAAGADVAAQQPGASPSQVTAAPEAQQALDQLRAAERAAEKPKIRLSRVTLSANDVITQPVKSYAELRFKGVVRQSLDISCGAAALATLLKGYFGLPVDEPALIKAMLTNASPDDAKKIAVYGFSMLELKHYAESQGLVAGGFKSENATQLRKLRAPVIALVNSRGYKHFVVIRHGAGRRGRHRRPGVRQQNRALGQVRQALEQRHPRRGGARTARQGELHGGAARRHRPPRRTAVFVANLFARDQLRPGRFLLT